MDRGIQLVLVETSTCYCRVDAGLKSIVGAKIFVPGSKFWIRFKTRCPCIVDAGLKTIAGVEKFVPGKAGTILRIQHNIQPSIQPSCDVKSRNAYPLLPGLPDDLAIACLIQVPRIEHRILRLVCKRWYRLLAEDLFYSLCENLGFAEEWIYVIKMDKYENILFHAFDPIYQLWQPLPPVPREYSKALGFGCAVLSGCHLYLFGGYDLVTGHMKMRRVIFYSARTNKWHQAPDMLRRRCICVSCVINNCLYVAGGEREGEHQFLRSPEVYDPNKNRWSFIADMETPMESLFGVVYNGKWFLKGLGSQEEVLNQVYHPETDKWFQVDDGMVAGWTYPCISINGNLYAAGCKDGCKLRIYDMETDSWIKHIDSKQHLGNSEALKAEALAPLNKKLLCIIRNNLSISVVDVSQNSDEERGEGVIAYHLWETIEEGRGQFKRLITNIWSSIADRDCLRSRILHCQIMQV